MKLVAGVSATRPKPRVWDPESDFYLSDLQAVMLSFAEFAKSKTLMRDTIKNGIREKFGIPEEIEIFIDNGCFSLLKGGMLDTRSYLRFITNVIPDWCPIPKDSIPALEMGDEEQLQCVLETMDQNVSNPELVPVIHTCRLTPQYVEMMNTRGIGRPRLAIGGLVPILRKFPPKHTYEMLNTALNLIRSNFGGSELHYFGLGGLTSIHLGALAGAHTADSSSWRINSTYGMVFIPRNGTRARTIAQVDGFGKKTNKLNGEEIARLEECECPACASHNVKSLQKRGVLGFCIRATHNLWMVLNEARDIELHTDKGDYDSWAHSRLKGSSYAPLVDSISRRTLQSKLL